MVRVFLDYGFAYLGASPVQMRCSSVQERLLGIFPRKVGVDADEAGEVVLALRQFWLFLQRQYGLPNAAKIINLLDDAF